MQIIMGIIQVVTGIISGNWSQVFSGMLNIVSGVFGLVLSVISGAIRLVISVVGNGLAAVFGFFSGIFTSIVNYVSNSWNSIINGAGAMIGNLVGFFGGIGGKLLGALGDIGSTLFNTGRNIIQGLIDGIGSMMGAIGRAVLSIVPEAIRGPFEDLMGIHSPSRVAIWWGHMIGGGAIEGLEDMYRPIAEAAGKLFPSLSIPEFASAGAQAGYASAADYAGNTGYSGPLIHQDVHPAEKMSEENLASISAGKIIGALT
jgi:phage-related protein